MAAIQRKIEEYIHLFAKYPVNKNAEEKFLNYQRSLAELCELLDKYDPTPKTEIAPELTRDDVLLLRESYGQAMAAGKDFQKFLSDNAEANNENTRARNELIDSMFTLLDSDFTALSNLHVLDTEGVTFSRVLEQSRSYQVDITGQNISKTGANMSSRIPISFQDRNGNEIKGFFTENESPVLDNDASILYQKAVKDHPEFKRIFSDLLRGDCAPFYTIFGNNDKAKAEMEQILKGADTAHLFDTHVAEWLTRKPGETDADVKAYIQSITKDTTFSQRMYDFCNEYTKLSAKYAILKYGGKIKQGSNISERNAAMSTMGDLLGVPKLLARSEKMNVIDNGEVKKGVFMEFAAGSDIKHIKENDPITRVTRNGLNNPDAFKSIADLQVLDFVCGNVDRHGGNMFYKFEETDRGPKFTGVVGIDNDLSFGKVDPYSTDNMRMVDPTNMLVISESMANKITIMTREMLEVALKNYSFSKEELQAAWDRIDALKNAIDLGAAYYNDHPDEKPKPGLLKIVKDGEWNRLDLRDLAVKQGTQPGKEAENAQDNYFSTIFRLPEMVPAEIAYKAQVENEEKSLKEKHPALFTEKQPFSMAKGTKLEELNTAGLAEIGRDLDVLQAEMERANKGFFVGSSQFDHVIKAFRQVKELSERATPDMSAQEIKNLHDAYERLGEVTQVYLEKKEAERAAKAKEGKKPSDVAKTRTAFAQKLQRFTRMHERALSNEYVDLQELYEGGVNMIGKRNATAKQVKDAATAILAGYALRDSDTLCTRSQFKEAVSRVMETPGYDSFMKNTAQIKNVLSTAAAAQGKNDPARMLQNKLWNHARLTLRENGPMEKLKEPIKPAGPDIKS